MSTERVAEALGKFRFVAEHENAKEDVTLATEAESELAAIRRAAAVIHAERTGETYSETEYAEAIALMGRIAQEAER